MYSIVMVVAMAGAPEAPACCPTICCPKICLPEFHCPKFHCPTFCCKPACPTPCAAPCAPAPCAPVCAPAPCAPAPCAPTCAPTCAPKHCCFLSKCFSFCGGHGSGYAEPVYVAPVGPATVPTVPVDPKKEMPKTTPKVGG